MKEQLQWKANHWKPEPWTSCSSDHQRRRTRPLSWCGTYHEKPAKDRPSPENCGDWRGYYLKGLSPRGNAALSEVSWKPVISKISNGLHQMVPGDCNDIKFNVWLDHSPHQAVNTEKFWHMAWSSLKDETFPPPSLLLVLKIINGNFWKWLLILSFLVFWRASLASADPLQPSTLSTYVSSVQLLRNSSILKLCLHSHECTHTQLRKRLNWFYISWDFCLPVLEWPHLFWIDVDYENIHLCMLSERVIL